VKDKLAKALGEDAWPRRKSIRRDRAGVARERIEDALRLLRDEHEYQQLMEIAGVDYPSRNERFEVVYMLLSLTKNHRIRSRSAPPRTPRCRP
jgi:NADH-quinone oxidoreductase subunit C